ncbi:MAG: zinc-ribbon domain-containing protein [Lachnospiraceae bacterium]|nr:zinc-ribbon domain-containing protein [Lachnospiraceae bacterium]
MICKECGAGLMETDQFCPKCGTRVIKEMRCPDCGAVLREGTKFCHKCGRLIGGGSGRKKTDEAEDISIDAMEQNILSETAAEIKAGRNAEREPRRTSSAAGKTVRSSTPKSASARSGSEHASSARGTSSRSASEHATGSKSTSARSSAERTSPSKSAAGRGTSAKSASGHGSASGRHSSIPEPPRKNKKRIDYREDDWEEEDWEDEDDWDEDDEEGIDVITIMTVIMGCVLLIVVAVLGYNLYKQYAPKNYGKETEISEDENAADVDAEEQTEPAEVYEPDEEPAADGDGTGTYQIIVTGKEVNVRDQPSTSGTKVLGKVREGEVYTCYGTAEDGQWYEIRLEDGTPGYVFHQYVSVE